MNDTRALAAPSPSAPDPHDLRNAALAADELGTLQHVGDLWPTLAAGGLRMVDVFYTPERWFLVLADSVSREEPERSSARSRLVLELVLSGQRQKVAAIESGIAPSTVCAWLHRALADMGVGLTPRKVPAMLALLARAGAGLKVPPCRVSQFVHASHRCLSLSIERPELNLARKLPPAEYAVLCGIIEGRAYAELAAERGTAIRTVANQVASLFHRLGVSGRGELITFLLAESDSLNEPTTGPLAR